MFDARSRPTARWSPQHERGAITKRSESLTGPWRAQLREGGEDGPGRFQVRRLESLGERAVDHRERLPGLLGLSSPLPETREARGRAQLEQARLLSACGLQRFSEASLRCILVGRLLDQA